MSQPEESLFIPFQKRGRQPALGAPPAYGAWPLRLAASVAAWLRAAPSGRTCLARNDQLRQAQRCGLAPPADGGEPPHLVAPSAWLLWRSPTPGSSVRPRAGCGLPPPANSTEPSRRLHQVAAPSPARRAVLSVGRCAILVPAYSSLLTSHHAMVLPPCGL